MFGYNYDIVSVFPNFFLNYLDKRNAVGDMRWINRVYSSSGDWSGNLFDFFFRICFKITEDIPTPFKMKGFFRDDNVPMKRAVREALCNTLSNADFHMELGVVIKQYHDKIVFSNPGALAIPKNIALLGGTSKARNKNILDIFSYINIGERGGTGIPLIMTATKEENYPNPILEDSFNPDETKLTIYIKTQSNLEDTPKTETTVSLIMKLNIRNDLKTKLLKLHKNMQLNIFSNSSIVKILDCSTSSADNYIKILLVNNLIEPVKGYGNGKYKFK